MSSKKFQEYFKSRPHLKAKATELVACEDGKKRENLVIELLEATQEKSPASLKRLRSADEEVSASFEVSMLQPRGKGILTFGKTEMIYSPSARKEEVLVEVPYSMISFVSVLPAPKATPGADTILLVLKEAVQMARSTSRIVGVSYKAGQSVTETVHQKDYKDLYQAISSVLDGFSVSERCLTSPGQFLSSSLQPSFEGRVKASTGFLYPTAKGVFFGPRPLHFVPAEDMVNAKIEQTAFSSFEICVNTKTDGKLEFSGIEKIEMSPVRKYISNMQSAFNTGGGGSSGGASGSKGKEGASGSAQPSGSTIGDVNMLDDEESSDGTYDPEDEGSSGRERSGDDELGDVLPEKDSDSD